MSRGLWFVAGAGAGIYAVVRGRRAAEALTVDGIGDRLAGVAVGLRMFREEVAHGRAEREVELRERLTLAPPGGPPQIAPGPEHLDQPAHIDQPEHTDQTDQPDRPGQD